MIPQHSSESNEQYTPPPIVKATRNVLGIIDLDPASCPIAQQTVKAEKWYGPGSPWVQDGLSTSWAGNVFLNPPGGHCPPEHKGEGTSSFAALWWHKLTLDWEAGLVHEAVFIGFSLEILRSTQSFEPCALDFPYCVPRTRIKFETINRVRTKGKKAGQLIDPEWPEGVRVVGDSPTNANAIIYLPSSNVSTYRFKEAFSQFGKVVMP